MSKTTNKLQEAVINQLKTIYDPEIPTNIYDLGLIYEVRVNEKKEVKVIMTLTSPHCPVAESMPKEVEDKVRAVKGVADAQVEITWDPPWEMDMMSDAAKLECGLL